MVVITLLDSLKIQEAVPDFSDCMLGAPSQNWPRHCLMSIPQVL